MKKLIIFLLLIVFLFNSFNASGLYNTDNLKEDNTELKLEYVNGLLFRFRIKNIGGINATNGSWDIEFKGGMVLGREYSGKFLNIKPNDSKLIVMQPPSRFFPSYPLLGIGFVDIYMSADAENANKTILSAKGFLFGSFVFGVKKID